MSGLIPQRFIDDLLDRVDLAELIGNRVTLKKAGGNFKARCPFHDEKTPSFNVRPDKGFYHCFGCGAHGDAISFVREMDHLGFTEAVEELARRAGLEVPYDQAARQEMQQARTLTDALDFANRFYREALAQPAAKFARDYLQQRGLDQATTEQYQIGFAPADGTALYQAAEQSLQQPLIETGTISDRFGRPRDLFRNRVMFPIRNTRGRTVAFGGRTLGDDKAKYINSPESDVFHKSREIYGLFEAQQSLRRIDRLLVVEGYMDVIALAQHGIPEAVATLGTATNQDSLKALLRHSRHIVFCFDGDNAGFRAADRAMENVLELLADGMHLQFLMLPEGEDPDTLVRSEGAEAFRARIAAAAPFSRFLFDRQSEGLDLSLPEHRGELRARAEPLLGRLPRSTLRDAMWHEMLRLCGRREWQPRRRQNDAGRVTEAPVTVKLNRDTSLCLGLLEAPDLAAEALDICRQDRSLSRAGEFAQWITDNALQDRGQILQKLAFDAESRKQFQDLFDGIEHVPSREHILMAARELLTPDPETMRKQRIAELVRRKAEGNFTAEDHEQLRQLSRGAKRV
jgi:DNA primase